MGKRAWAAVCCAAVAAGVLVDALPRAAEDCCLTPDAVGYLATAHSWTHGAGFVDPILYSYYLEGARPPVPALAVRPPGVSLLLAPLLALGAEIRTVLMGHAIWASLVAVGCLLVALRTMPLPAATGFAIGVAGAPAWAFVSTKPLTEVTAVFVLLLAVAWLRAGMRSVRGGLLFALFGLAAWLVRPNLALILPAAALALACEAGPRAALRSRPLWACLLGFALLHQAVVRGFTAWTGFAPYAHYGVMAEIIDTGEVFHYDKRYVGVLAYLQSHGGAVLESIRDNLASAGRLLFVEDYYLYVGWLAVPGLVFALWRSGEGSLERRFVAFAGIGFTAVALATWGGFVGERYLLLGAVCGWFVGMSLLSAVAERVATWSGRAGSRRIPACLPVAVAALLWLLQGDAPSPDPWRGWRAAGESYRALCTRVDPDALVASVNPWWLHLWCGNAGLRLPTDLADADDLHRYLDDQRPGYLLAPDTRGWSFLPRSPRLARIGSLERPAPRPRLALYEVLDAGPDSRTWHAPPPLATGSDAR